MYRNSTPAIASILLSLTLSLVSNNLFAKGGPKYPNIKEFVPEGYRIFDTASGDFNDDGFKDYLVVLKSINENTNSNGERPLILLKGSAKNKFELVARNDSVVLCGNCGGVFGDPYQSVSIKKNLITIEHSIGGAWQWDRVVSFRYNFETKDIVLHEDITKSRQKHSPNNQKSIASNKSDFGVLAFTSYAYNKGF